MTGPVKLPDIIQPERFVAKQLKSFTNNFNALATYSKILNNHSLTALLGYEFINMNGKLLASRQDYILDNFEVLNAARLKAMPTAARQHIPDWFHISARELCIHG